MLTLGTWLAPIIAAVIAVVGIPVGLRIRLRRGRAIERIAAELARQASVGYPEQYGAWLEFYTGRRKDAEGINLIPPEAMKGEGAHRGCVQTARSMRSTPGHDRRPD